MELFASFPIVVQTLLLSCITCGLTILGSSMVFFFKTINQKVIDIMMSLSAGVMLASAFFSLLLPAIEQSETLFNTNYIIPTIGFFVGGILVVVVDIFLDKVTKNSFVGFAEKKKQFLLMSAITFHNIPEGMCVGVAVASVNLGLEGGLISAIMLAVGIGIQNFPEGASVSLPMRTANNGRLKSFLWGAFSGIVEPVFAVLACLTASFAVKVLPFLLALSSGAMISVACTELISESAKHDKNLTTLFVLLGFCIMMVLDLAL